VLLTPVPDVATLGVFEASLVIVTFPVTSPVPFGAKTTPRFAVCPAAIVAPVNPPVALKPVPLTLTDATLTLAFPVFLTLTFNWLELPTVSFPKLRLELDSESDFVVVTPVPLKAMVTVGLLLLLLRVMVAVLLPELVGAKVIVRLMDCPVPSHSGMYRLLMLNDELLNVALEIVIVAAPVFLICSVCEFLVPIATLPKLALPGVTLSVPSVAAALELVVKAQPQANKNNQKIEASR
jgi:hypothetical protein